METRHRSNDNGARTERIVIVHRDRAERIELERLVRRLGVRVEALHSVDETIERVGTDASALVLLDADSGGLELCREIFDTDASTSIVMINARRCQPRDRIAGLLAGADDYLSEPFDRDELLARIRRLLDRRRQWSSSVPPPPNSLSPRELEVLEWLAVGRSTQEIAHELVISPKTVATHIQHILSKLGVHSQAQAVAHAHMHGLVANEPQFAQID